MQTETESETETETETGKQIGHGPGRQDPHRVVCISSELEATIGCERANLLQVGCLSAN